MFAITFDLVVRDTAEKHPQSVSQAYLDIEQTLSTYGFIRIQGSVYVTQSEDLANLFVAIMALKKLSWFSTCVRDIRAFKVEQWSDFTKIIKDQL